ncbi:hypothetical protein H4582DRAFT_2056207 [Lactarius indigo]|nr:hypothetical protein H4582DRAFT_2056207 [Lactarius indigo]
MSIPARRIPFLVTQDHSASLDPSAPGGRPFSLLALRNRTSGQRKGERMTPERPDPRIALYQPFVGPGYTTLPERGIYFKYLAAVKEQAGRATGAFLRGGLSGQLEDSYATGRGRRSFGNSGYALHRHLARVFLVGGNYHISISMSACKGIASATRIYTRLNWGKWTVSSIAPFRISKRHEQRAQRYRQTMRPRPSSATATVRRIALMKRNYERAVQCSATSGKNRFMTVQQQLDMQTSSDQVSDCGQNRRYMILALSLFVLVNVPPKATNVREISLPVITARSTKEEYSQNSASTIYHPLPAEFYAISCVGAAPSRFQACWYEKAKGRVHALDGVSEISMVHVKVFLCDRFVKRGGRQTLRRTSRTTSQRRAAYGRQCVDPWATKWLSARQSSRPPHRSTCRWGKSPPWILTWGSSDGVGDEAMKPHLHERLDDRSWLLPEVPRGAFIDAVGVQARVRVRK